MWMNNKVSSDLILEGGGRKLAKHIFMTWHKESILTKLKAMNRN